MRIRFSLMLLTVLMMGFIAPHAHAQRYFMDHYYVAPPEEEPEITEKMLRERRYPLPEATARAWLAQHKPDYVVDDLDFSDVAMKQLLDAAPSHQVAVNHRLDVEADDIFDAPIMDGGKRIYLATLTSPGAYALRLRVDLMGLRRDDQLWLLDAKGDATFGPYTVNNANVDGQWLPPTLSDTVALALTSPDDMLPLLMIMEVAHFYKPIVEKQWLPLSCNIPIAQETDATAQQIAAGVGKLLIPLGNGQGLCTGTLLNSFKTVAGVPAPYVISAWHCFGEGVNYDGLTMFWDYRSPTGDASEAPSLYDLDFNMGASLVDNSFALDFALLELKNQVAAGPYGRAWAGWDSEAPEQTAAVQVIHHPVGADMKTSYGRITNPSTDVCMNMRCSLRYDKQIEVLWNAGVTEQGSSGSTLLMRSNNYRLAGVLSNGTVHSCTDTSNNLDNFGPFHAYFPQIGCYLVDGYTCAPPYEQEAVGCFLFRKMGLPTEMLRNLRVFRDEALGKSALGRKLVQDYYMNSRDWEAWIDESHIINGVFEVLLTFAAAYGAMLP